MASLQEVGPQVGLGVDIAEIRIHKAHDSFLQQRCFRQIKASLEKSEHGVLAGLRLLNARKQEFDEHVLNRENVSLLNHLIKMVLDGRLHSTEIIEQCLKILSRWCLQTTVPSTGFEFKQSAILETALLVRTILSKPTPTRLFPLCIFFLGVASGVLSEDDTKSLCYSIIAHCMRHRPELIIKSRHIVIILAGISHLLSNVSETDFFDGAVLLISMWSQPRPAGNINDEITSTAPLALNVNGDGVNDVKLETHNEAPPLEDRLRVFQLFGHIYLRRRKKSDERIAQATRNSLANLPQDPATRAHFFKELACLREKEDEWLVVFAQTLNSLFRSKNTSIEIMALCAATGIWREMSSDGRVSPAEVVETFNSMITSAIMNVRLRRDVMPDWREWRKTVAVICVHIDKRLPFFSDEVLLQLVVDVLIEDILSIDWLMELDPSVVKPAVIMKRVEEHTQSGIFRLASIFTRAAATLYLHTTNHSLHFAILYRLCTFCKNLHTSWKEFSSKIPPSASTVKQPVNSAKASPSELSLEKAIKRVLIVTFLSCVVFAKYVEQTLNAEHALVILEMLSYVEFCRIKEFITYNDVLETMVAKIASSDSRFLLQVTRVLATPWLSDINFIDKKNFDALSKLELSRLRFYLGILEVIVHRVPEVLTEEHQLLQERILPLLFIIICHSHRLTNKRAHGVFAQIFAQKHPLREELVPYYLRLSLENFPDITAAESLAATSMSIAMKFPETHPLIGYTVTALADKIKAIRFSKSATLLIIALFRLVVYVPLHYLRFTMQVIENVVLSASRGLQIPLLKLLFSIIANNYDYTRKNICVTWYLELQRKVGVVPPELLPKSAYDNNQLRQQNQARHSDIKPAAPKLML